MDSIQTLVANLDLQFTSGNGVPVTRAVITQEVWADIRAHLLSIQGGDSSLQPRVSTPKDAGLSEIRSAHLLSEALHRLGVEHRVVQGYGTRRRIVKIANIDFNPYIIPADLSFVWRKIVEAGLEIKKEYYPENIIYRSGADMVIKPYTARNVLEAVVTVI